MYLYKFHIYMYGSTQICDYILFGWAVLFNFWRRDFYTSEFLEILYIQIRIGVLQTPIWCFVAAIWVVCIFSYLLYRPLYVWISLVFFWCVTPIWYFVSCTWMGCTIELVCSPLHVLASSSFLSHVWRTFVVLQLLHKLAAWFHFWCGEGLYKS